MAKTIEGNRRPMTGLRHPVRFRPIKRIIDGQGNQSKTTRDKGMSYETHIILGDRIRYQPESQNSHDGEDIERIMVPADPVGKWVHRDRRGIWRHSKSRYWGRSGDSVHRMEPVHISSVPTFCLFFLR